MKSTGATFRKYSSAGVDWASTFLGIGLADAMATALMVSGDDGATWFGCEELHGYSAWVIERNDGGAWGVGPLITAR